MRPRSETDITGADRYPDLTFFLGAHERTTRAYVEHEEFDPAAGMTALVHDGAAAWIQHTGPLQARLRELADRWIEAGKPAVTGWSTLFVPHPDLTAPLLTPSRWQHAGRR